MIAKNNGIDLIKRLNNKFYSLETQKNVMINLLKIRKTKRNKLKRKKLCKVNLTLLSTTKNTQNLI